MTMQTMTSTAERVALQSLTFRVNSHLKVTPRMRKNGMRAVSATSLSAAAQTMMSQLRTELMFREARSRAKTKIEISSSQLV